MSDSPITDALVQRHTDETMALETRWPEGEFVDRHEWKRHAKRQAQELLDHARRLEHDRGDLISLLNRIYAELSCRQRAIHFRGGVAIAYEISALLSRMEKT